MATGTIITITTMSDRALLTLTNWLSPGFPVGAFSYSHGLEQAVEDGSVSNGTSLFCWIEAVLRHGAGRNDAILLCEAWRAADAGTAQELAAICELAAAFRASREMRTETMQQGKAFLDTAAPIWGTVEGLDPAPAYPVAVGALAAKAGIGLRETATLYLNAFAANLVLAALRLAPIGQSEGQAILFRLNDCVLAVADEALTSDLDDLGGAAMGVDIASMRHETQYSRLFRS